MSQPPVRPLTTEIGEVTLAQVAVFQARMSAGRSWRIAAVVAGMTCAVAEAVARRAGITLKTSYADEEPDS